MQLCSQPGYWAALVGYYATGLLNDERAARNLPYFSFKTVPTLNLTLPVSYWLKFYTKILAENHEPIVQ